MKVIRFSPYHLEQLRLQPAQAWMRPMVTDASYAAQMNAADSRTVISDDGQVIAVAALVHLWPGRAHLSALVGEQAGRSFVAMHRALDRWLIDAQCRRIEATVDGAFEAGHRWLRLLGFVLETPNGMPAYRPDGGLSYLYARVRND